MNLFHAGFLKTLRCLQVIGCQFNTATTYVTEPHWRLGLDHTQTSDLHMLNVTTYSTCLRFAETFVAERLEWFLITGETIFLLLVLRLNSDDFRSW